MAALADFARQLECAAAGLQGSERERVSSNAWLVEVAGHGESPRLCEALLRDGLCASEGSCVVAAGIVAEAAVVQPWGEGTARQLLELAAFAPSRPAAARLSRAACVGAVRARREADVVRALLQAAPGPAGDLGFQERLGRLRYGALEALATALGDAASAEELACRPGALEACGAAAGLVEVGFAAEATSQGGGGYPDEAGRLLAAWADCGLLGLGNVHAAVVDALLDRAVGGGHEAAAATLRACVDASLASAEDVDGARLARVAEALGRPPPGAFAALRGREDLCADLCGVACGVLDLAWDDEAWFGDARAVGLLGVALSFLRHPSPIVTAAAADGVVRLASLRETAPWKRAFFEEAWDRGLDAASFRRVRANEVDDEDDLFALRDRDLAPLFLALGEALGGDAVDARFPTCDGLSSRDDYERVEAALFAAACLSDETALKVALRDNARRRVDLRLPPGFDDEGEDALAASLERYAEILIFRSDEARGESADTLVVFRLEKPPPLPGVKRKTRDQPDDAQRAKVPAR